MSSFHFQPILPTFLGAPFSLPPSVVPIVGSPVPAAAAVCDKGGRIPHLLLPVVVTGFEGKESQIDILLISGTLEKRRIALI